jgi:transglutaminase-like putative cysteine protease
VVGRRNSDGPVAAVPLFPGEAAGLAHPTTLTRAGPALARAALELADVAVDRLDFAERACAWAHRALTYRYGVTRVSTPAQDALAGGFGVCQDYAHIMLALCRSVGVPARYVSGHLLGEGGSHAWVEVIIEPTSAPGFDGHMAVAFDPTHDRRPGPAYITVAVGRDYADVAPTSGYFDGHAEGKLSVRKKVAPIGSPGGDLTPVLAALASG